MGIFAPALTNRSPKTQVPNTGTRGTLYEGVGSVKRHVDCAGRGARFFLLP